ncbi:MAG: protein translocase subunit SecD [Nevskiales bacterium]
MHRFESWKYVVLVLALLVGTLYAVPNLFGEDLAVQVSNTSGEPVSPGLVDEARTALQSAGLTPRDVAIEDGRLMARLEDAGAQLKAAEVLKRRLSRDHVVALNLASRNPSWLAAIGAQPMALGLDLRGGVHFLLQVDVAAATQGARERYAQDLRQELRRARIRYLSGEEGGGDGDTLRFRDTDTREKALALLTKEFPELSFPELNDSDRPGLLAVLPETELKRIGEFSMTQSLTTLRNRVNELGVAEPVVQRQGTDRIVVQLPGVQDTARAKEILGATATLEYRLVAEDQDPVGAERSGYAPPGTELFKTREGQPILLKREVITTGEHIVDATSGIDPESGSPAVNVTLDSQGGKSMLETTTANVNRRMAVLFVEVKTQTRFDANGQEIREKVRIEEVINDAVIRGVFGKRFQTTGLESKEAKDLALLLRAGALPAPIDIVEERTVGPSLGADNIRKGFTAAVLGLALVASFMVFYYRVFGLFAIAALLLNLILIVAALSLLQATLTMPGIAGILLTMGIAVDANVLIYERIREELRRGMSPHAAIHAGYERAFLTIADANITVIIGTVVLFTLGAGPIKGFAITLGLGILISQFTAVVGSRALAQLAFGRRKLTEVPIW